MNDNPVVIIGAGLAGLATGCFAQMNGYQSHIFEHHSAPGGVAAAWKRKGYLFDGGIHFVMGHKPGTGLYDLYRQLGIVPTNRFVDLTTYGRYVDELSGRAVEVSQDLDRLARDLKALSPLDARVVDELVAGARAMQGLDMSEMGLSVPPELAGLPDRLKEIWSMRRMLKYLIGKHGQPVSSYARSVRDPYVRSLLENLFLPEVPVYFVFMLLALLADGQLGLLEGGCLGFVRALEKRYLEMGGQVTYRATVEEILVEDDRAIGVRLSEASPLPREQRAHAVISAADGFSTIFRMLGGRYVSDKIKERYSRWPTFRPLFMINYGVARELTGQTPFTMIALEHPLNVGDWTVDHLLVRTFNYSPRFAPPGKTVVQVETETGWDYWNDLRRKDKARYDAEKLRIATQVLERLETHYPGLSASVEVTDVSTPYTTWRYTLNRKGAWEGWMMTPEAIRTPVERTLPGLGSFYMAGQWVMPGGGVPPCLYSGKHAVQLLCRQDRKLFSTSEL